MTLRVRCVVERAAYFMLGFFTAALLSMFRR